MDATSSIEIAVQLASSTGSMFNGVIPILYMVFGIFIVFLGLSFLFVFIPYLKKL